jgi:zinc protease
VGQVAFAQAVWGEASPFAREPRLSTLAQVARDDLLALHAAALVPGSVRLVVTGDFDADTVLGQLRALLADWSPGPGVSRKLPQAPAPNGRQVIIVPTTSAQAKVRLGHLGPARHDPRDFALKLLDSLLGGSGGPSRLYTEIRDKRGLAYSVDSSIGTGLVRGLVVMAADTKPENTREVIARCIETMEAVRGAAPPTDEEITLAREGFINAYAFRFDTAARAAHLRALSDFEGYPADYFRTFREKLSKVTSAEVGQVAREVLDPNSLQIVVVGDPQRMGDLSEFGPVRTVLGDFEPPGE